MERALVAVPITILRIRIDKVKKFDIVRETIQIINEYSYYITGLIRLQLQEGKDADNQPALGKYGPFYTDATVFNKEHNNSITGLGKVTDYVTNYMSGKFYNSLKVNTNGTVFEIDSDVPYFLDILERSGERIVELNEQHLKEFRRDILIPELKRRLNV